ncbi:HAD family hydrolase [Agilicoccus flavus]|uniref:HAD family hydrolase n=1 Tax=Agilicoccus flavus TaxID=2775968 RepID=UPI001CF62368|nr:HAD family hydrolase [Agilicoccus flavus]
MSATDPTRSGAPTPIPPGDEWAEPVRGLVLDIDDTLVDTQAAMRSSCAQAAAAAWPGRGADDHELISDVFYTDPENFFDRYTRGEFPFEAMRRARYARALADLGLPDERFETFEGAYLDAFAGAQVLFADAVPLLDAADRAGVAVCFLTNSGDRQTAIKLEAVGLAGRAPVVTTDTIGVGKPDPRLFALACERAGVTAAEVLCVGDTLPTDVLGARGAGLRVAWLQRPDRPEPRHAGWGTPIDDPGVRIVPDLDAVTALL